MKHLKSYKLFESRNWKALPKEIYNGALLELSKIESIDDLTETINNFITNNLNSHQLWRFDTGFNLKINPC